MQIIQPEAVNRFLYYTDELEPYGYTELWLRFVSKGDTRWEKTVKAEIRSSGPDWLWLEITEVGDAPEDNAGGTVSLTRDSVIFDVYLCNESGDELCYEQYRFNVPGDTVQYEP